MSDTDPCIEAGEHRKTQRHAGEECPVRFNANDPVRAWDMEEYDEDKHMEMWAVFNALPLGSVVATGFIDDGLVYFEKVPPLDGLWIIAQVDNPNVEDVFEVESSIEGDSACIDAGGDIERAYVIRVGVES